MEGYLIRVPLSVWGACANDETNTRRKSKRNRNGAKPQAKLLYYILGEGYLEGYASPEDLEPVESFRLTSLRVDVEPIYSMHMLRVTTSLKGMLQPTQQQATTEADDSSDDDDEGDDESQASLPVGHPIINETLLLFAGDRALVDKWCKKLLNWNRYVFAGEDTGDAAALAKAKSDLVASFCERNTRGLFTTPCELVDCTKQEAATTDPPPLNVPTGTITSQPTGSPPPPPVEKPGDVSKPATLTEIKPLWLLLNRGPSRRISAIPHKS